jgi:hypothetical protein
MSFINSLRFTNCGYACAAEPSFELNGASGSDRM